MFKNIKRTRIVSFGKVSHFKDWGEWTEISDSYLTEIIFASAAALNCKVVNIDMGYSGIKVKIVATDEELQKFVAYLIKFSDREIENIKF